MASSYQKTLKIILVGSRYTGKGQIGRSWGKTDADLPTLQPVMLYDRIVFKKNYKIRVVAWILSFDLEFELLRSSFYINPEPDGIIYTFDLTNQTHSTLEDLDQFKNEILSKIHKEPPAVLFGVRLNKKNMISDNEVEKAKNWAKKNGIINYYQADYENRDEFNKIVEDAFYSLIDFILV